MIKQVAVYAHGEPLRTISNQKRRVSGVNATAVAAIVLFLSMQVPLSAQSITGGSHSARPQITREISGAQMVPLAGYVRKDLTSDRDLGAVDDGVPVPLFLILKRSPE
jgi:hypothetical protein